MGTAQLPCFCVGGREFCVSSPQTRQANSKLRQRRSRPQSTLQPASSGVFLILLAARYLAQLMWAAAEAAATWTWVIQPLRGSRGEKATNQAWTSAPCVQSSNNSAFGARSTRWPLIFRARRSDETHQQATAPQPCTGGRAMWRRRFSAAHPRRPGSGAVRNQQELNEAAGLGARAGSAACRATQRDITGVR